ncbi:MAG: hypothetical protein Q8M22_07735 [Actinomycetota bacterium]|nr:hypothetical protein [Actinomycetota bacterium]
MDPQPDDELDELDDEMLSDDDLELDDLDAAVPDEEVLDPVSDPVTTARRRHGAAGAILAAGMFGLDKALGRKVKEEAPIVIAAGTEPVDIDSDGIEIPIDDDTSVFAPPQPPSDPFPPRRRRR